MVVIRLVTQVMGATTWVITITSNNREVGTMEEVIKDKDVVAGIITDTNLTERSKLSRCH